VLDVHMDVSVGRSISSVLFVHVTVHFVFSVAGIPCFVHFCCSYRSYYIAVRFVDYGCQEVTVLYLASVLIVDVWVMMFSGLDFSTLNPLERGGIIIMCSPTNRHVNKRSLSCN